jgi:hypothetical protein
MRSLVYLLFLGAVPAYTAVDFNRQVRPILSDNCFTCHGPDSTKRMAKLRLDISDGGIFANSVVVPSDAAGSRLYQRISNPDTAKRMPPAYSGRTLTPQQIAMIKQWIDEGAKWQKHWAFQAPVRSDPPEPKEQGWVRNPIDQFVLFKLEQEGLKHSPEADKATLLRRVTYDLTGLPPTIAEVNSFLADKSPAAYEKRVDALLASPRYGERMAAQWLDLARYADTHGYHIDSHREMWHWRDWVIDAFNRNLPYDQFTIDQLAGDLIPNATTEQKLASGFNRNHMINFEGGAIPEEYQVEYVVDRLEATSTTFMGLTMGCARCHDHKYDPIPQRDFYRFFAFFNNVSEQGLDGRSGNAEPFLQLPSETQKAREDELKAAIAAHEKALPEETVAKQQSDWEVGARTAFQNLGRTGLAAHYEFDGSLVDSSGHYQYGRVTHGDLTYSNGAVERGADFDGETTADFSHFAALDPAKPFAVSFWINVNGKPRDNVFRQADAIDVWLDDFELSGVQQRVPRMYVSIGGHSIRTVQRLPWPDNMNHIALNHRADGKLDVFINGQAVKTESSTATPTDVAQSAKAADTRPHAAKELADSSRGAAEPAAVLRGSSEGPNGVFQIDRFTGKIDDLRIYNRVLGSEEIAYLHSQEPLRAILAILPAKRSKDQSAWIRNYYLTHAAPADERQSWQELNALREDEKKLTAEIPTTMVMNEITDKPRDTFILARGDYRNQTEKVTPGVPSVLPPLPDGAPPNRLTLAKWLVDPANPLTARVAVNRYWQMYFGTGIVKTTENFGSQGDPPSNQLLLDWLAIEFVRTGWDIKAMQRLIVTSAAYRQSSIVTPELLEKDPDNHLVARGPRFRLPAEMIRDGDLYLSGLLKEQVGGAPVNPYQPKGVWEEIAFGDGFTAQAYVQGHGDDLHRRSIYTFWKRTAPPPEMLTFDTPSREKCSARRTITNTPLQALVLLNDTTYVEAARSLAERMMLDGGENPAGQIQFGFRAATAREAQPKELAVLRDTFDAELLDYKRHEDRAQALLKNGEAAVNSKLDKPELAAMTTVASMILNLDEVMTKQ